jgi:hypothetical protein
MLIGTFEAVLTCQLDAARTVRARDTRANFPMPGHALDLYLVVAGRQVKASRASVRRSGQPPQNQAETRGDRVMLEIPTSTLRIPEIAFRKRLYATLT